jgi:hypothetical protein
MDLTGTVLAVTSGHLYAAVERTLQSLAARAAAEAGAEREAWWNATDMSPLGGPPLCDAALLKARGMLCHAPGWNAVGHMCAAACVPCCALLPPYVPAFACLEAVTLVARPADKVWALLRVFDAIAVGAALETLHPDRVGSELRLKQLSADDLLPRLAFVVAHSECDGLLTALSIMESLLPDDDAASEKVYALATLTSAAMAVLSAAKTSAP